MIGDEMPAALPAIMDAGLFGSAMVIARGFSSVSAITQDDTRRVIERLCPALDVRGRFA
jgi:hypothetical protein